MVGRHAGPPADPGWARGSRHRPRDPPGSAHPSGFPRPRHYDGRTCPLRATRPPPRRAPRTWGSSRTSTSPGCEDPASVDERWRAYFETLPAGAGRSARPVGLARPGARARDGARARTTARPSGSGWTGWSGPGGPSATCRPTSTRSGLERRRAERLDLAEFGLTEADLDRPAGPHGGRRRARCASSWRGSRRPTAGRWASQLGHIHDRELRGWLEQRMERTRNRLTLTPDVKRQLLEKLLQAEMFEQFLGTRFLGAKRFSLEGAEVLRPAPRAAPRPGRRLRRAQRGHRHGPPRAAQRARQRDGQAAARHLRRVPRPGHHQRRRRRRREVPPRATRAPGTPPTAACRLSLAFNPSHLEWIDPVVQGRVRAKQDRFSDAEGQRSIPVLIHGDAAFAGQGIVAETFNMSELPAYRCGGTIHVVVNNQIGFTTSPRDARSTIYATDVALMLDIPVFHVNGEDLEAVAQAVLLAADFRQRLHRDVVIDLWTLPQVRPQRGGRAHLHPAGHVPGHRGQDAVPARLRRASCSGEGAATEDAGGRHDPRLPGPPRGGLPGLGRRGGASRRRRRPRASGARYRGGPHRARRRRGHGACPPTGSRHVARHLSEIPAGFDRQPQDREALRGARRDGARQAPARLGLRRGAGLRDRSPGTGTRSGWSGRTSGAAPSATGTP